MKAESASSMPVRNVGSQHFYVVLTWRTSEVGIMSHA